MALYEVTKIIDLAISNTCGNHLKNDDFSEELKELGGNTENTNVHLDNEVFIDESYDNNDDGNIGNENDIIVNEETVEEMIINSVSLLFEKEVEILVNRSVVEILNAKWLEIKNFKIKQELKRLEEMKEKERRVQEIMELTRVRVEEEMLVFLKKKEELSIIRSDSIAFTLEFIKISVRNVSTGYVSTGNVRSNNNENERKKDIDDTFYGMSREEDSQMNIVNNSNPDPKEESYVTQRKKERVFKRLKFKMKILSNMKLAISFDEQKFLSKRKLMFFFWKSHFRTLRKGRNLEYQVGDILFLFLFPFLFLFLF